MQDNAQARTDEWDAEPTPENYGRALDDRILNLTSAGEVPPAAKIAFDGATGVDDLSRLHDAVQSIEIIAPHKATPIEYMRRQARNPLAEWEYLAAMRFRADFDVVHASSSGVANYASMGMYDTALSRQHAKAGYTGKGASRMASTGGIADARLSAMQRRGAFAQGAGHMSFYLAEAIIGLELWPRDVAAHLGESPDYIGRRFREALHDLAGFYRLHARGPRSGSTRAWHAPG